MTLSLSSPALCPPPRTESLGSVMVVDDNLRLSAEVGLVLQDAGWSVTCADDASSFRQLLSVSAPNIVLLDLNLPGEDGISLCKWLRLAHPEMGIVMLTARVMGSERTEGYMAGADVYLTKPTRPDELLAVVKNLLGRTRPHTRPVSGDSPWTLQLRSARLVSPALDILSLTPSECIFLRALAISTETASHEHLVGLINGGGYPEKSDKGRLEVLVSRLRTKLSKFGSLGLEIKTMHGTGYRLEGALRLQQEA